MFTNMLVIISMALLSLNPSIESNLVDWKVGDRLEYNLTLGPISGQAWRGVTKEEDQGKNIWVESNIEAMGQIQVIEQLIRRKDGKLLKLLVNGEEQDLDKSGKIEIVKEDYVSVTVPAGTFKALYLKINTEQAKGIETWINPAKTVMDGILKMVVPNQFGELVLELTGFKKVK